jgi:hypothetical protein
VNDMFAAFAWLSHDSTHRNVPAGTWCARRVKASSHTRPKLMLASQS